MMAADYHISTQYANWTFNVSPDVGKENEPWRSKSTTSVESLLPESRWQKIYVQQQLNKLGRRLNVRQLVQATAMVFVHRFYRKVEVKQTNLYLVLSTALYLACKIEECPQHIRVVVNEARSLWPDFIHTDPSRMGECEFVMISEMKAQLIVHHPYRYLLDLQKPLCMTQDELSLAWSVVNDHYLTELPLLHTPQTVAVAAATMAITVRPSHGVYNSTSLGSTLTRTTQMTAPQTRGHMVAQYFAQSSFDVEGVINCTQEMISLYVAWEEYNEKTCKEQIGRYIRSKGLDK